MACLSVASSRSCFALVFGLTETGRDRPFNILRAPSVSRNSLIPICILTLFGQFALDLVDLFLFAAAGNVVTLSIAFLLQKSSYNKDRGVTEDVGGVNAADVAKMKNSKVVVQKELKAGCLL